MLRQVATASITGYQRYISPHKGFSCAHRLLYGGESCSQYIKRMISQKGLVEGVKAARQRFQACRKANQILRARIYRSELEDEDEPKQPKRKNLRNQDNHLLDGALECCQCGGEGLDCSNSLFDLPSCDLPDCSDCASGIDCSRVDCGSGLDCSCGDCGSCG